MEEVNGCNVQIQYTYLHTSTYIVYVPTYNYVCWSHDVNPPTVWDPFRFAYQFSSHFDLLCYVWNVRISTTLTHTVSVVDAPIG